MIFLPVKYRGIVWSRLISEALIGLMFLGGITLFGLLLRTLFGSHPGVLLLLAYFLFSPWLTALKMAVRSAQQARPKEAFSTLQPE